MTEPIADKPEKRKEDKDGLKVLYQSTMQLRIHWSSAILSLIGYTLTINGAIWAFFIKAYIDSTRNGVPSKPEPGIESGWYLFAAASLSSISIILWRWYTHYLDRQIAGLYPDLVFCEGVLGIDGERGAWGYLNREVFKNVKDQNTVKCPQQRADLIKYLIDKKKIGCRGHNRINIVSLVAILIMWFLVILKAQSNSQYMYSIVGGLVALAWFASVFLGYSLQANPSDHDIRKAISEKEQEQETKN